MKDIVGNITADVAVAPHELAQKVAGCKSPLTKVASSKTRIEGSMVPAPFLPTERCPGCLSRFDRVLDLLAKEPLEVLGQHTWRTSFDNLAYLGSEANAAEARQASHAGQHDIDDKPFDVIVCTLRHDEVSN